MTGAGRIREAMLDLDAISEAYSAEPNVVALVAEVRRLTAEVEQILERAKCSARSPCWCPCHDDASIPFAERNERPGSMIYTQDAGAWSNRFDPIHHPAPLAIGLFVVDRVMTLGPISESGAAFMQAHEAWFRGLFFEVRERFAHAAMRVEKECRGEWSRDVVQPPDGALDLINSRLAYAFGPLVQCAMVR